RRLPSVADVESVTMLIPDDQPAKIDVLAAMRPLISHVRIAPRPPLDGAELIREIDKLGRRLAFATARPPLEAADQIGCNCGHIARRGEPRGRTGPNEIARGSTPLDARADATSGMSLAELQAGVAATPVTAESVPEELRRKFVGRDGRYLLEIYPRVNTWERG